MDTFGPWVPPECNRFIRYCPLQISFLCILSQKTNQMSMYLLDDHVVFSVLCSTITDYHDDKIN